MLISLILQNWMGDVWMSVFKCDVCVFMHMEVCEYCCCHCCVVLVSVLFSFFFPGLEVRVSEGKCCVCVTEVRGSVCVVLLDVGWQEMSE